MTDAPTTDQPAAQLRPPRPSGLLALVRVGRELGPYLLALIVWAVTAHYALNAVAAKYADELFTIALVLIKADRSPTPPAA